MTSRRERLLEFADGLEEIVVSEGGVQADIAEGARTVTLSATFAVLIAQEIKSELAEADRLDDLAGRVKALEAARAQAGR